VAIDFLLDRFKENARDDAIVWRGQTSSYDWLLDRIDHDRKALETLGIGAGCVVLLEADFSPGSVALFLALTDRGCILVPLTSGAEPQRETFTRIAQAEFAITVNADGEIESRPLSGKPDHAHFEHLRQTQHPGLVLFTSGSTGESKAVVHDLDLILEKFKTRRTTFRTLAFLLFDHIGGINTMLHTLSNAGCLVTIEDRRPEAVLDAIQSHRVDLLPTSPTFLNLLLLGEAYSDYDLTSLRLVTYGTEPMPESTLKRLHALLPDVDIRQTYGLSEVGILRTKSKGPDSLWMKLGGEGVETRLVDGVLQIRTRSAMLGYLNAPSPFTEDGWFDTGDEVEVDGEFVRILGRASEIINVGGEKVHPAEVESVIEELDNVAQASVYGENNPFIGQVVCARVTLLHDEPRKPFISRLKRHCSERLQRHKVPIRIELADTTQHTARFKKQRPTREVPAP
jgi:acyl-coenzyme A synthetase/AMP-(fatty) acid ligase